MFHKVEPGYCDGLRVDEDSNLWSSAGDGVHVYDPDGTLIGNLYLSGADEFGTREIGYVFARACWHKGYATEAARRLMAYAFERLATRRIIALCDTRNAASFALMERLGMRREGEFKKNVGFETDAHGNTIWTDSYQYAILKEEFEN